jgi:aldehyde dehydrogenase family 7 protein A1
MVNDHRIQLLSFTGSTNVGRNISAAVHKRFGRTILELGGNNACVIMNDADLELAFQAVVFACVGTAGQRCTTTRRIFLQEQIYDKFVERMVSAYKQVHIGDPLDTKTLMGPLHTKAAVKDYVKGIEDIKKQGGKVIIGGKVINGEGNYVEPTIIEINHDA